MDIKPLTDEEAAALMNEFGYAKHSDCRALVKTAFDLGMLRTLEAVKPVTAHLKTGNMRLDHAWSKIETLERAAQLKQVFEWVKTNHISLAEFSVIISRVRPA